MLEYLKKGVPMHVFELLLVSTLITDITDKPFSLKPILGVHSVSTQMPQPY